jgi:hypothetical protein
MSTKSSKRRKKARGMSHDAALEKAFTKGGRRYRMALAHFVPAAEGDSEPVCHVVENPDGTRTIVCE